MATETERKRVGWVLQQLWEAAYFPKNRSWIRRRSSWIESAITDARRKAAAKALRKATKPGAAHVTSGDDGALVVEFTRGRTSFRLRGNATQDYPDGIWNRWGLGGYIQTSTGALASADIAAIQKKWDAARRQAGVNVTAEKKGKERARAEARAAADAAHVAEVAAATGLPAVRTYHVGGPDFAQIQQNLRLWEAAGAQFLAAIKRRPRGWKPYKVPDVYGRDARKKKQDGYAVTLLVTGGKPVTIPIGAPRVGVVEVPTTTHDSRWGPAAGTRTAFYTNGAVMVPIPEAVAAHVASLPESVDMGNLREPFERFSFQEYALKIAYVPDFHEWMAWAAAEGFDVQSNRNPLGFTSDGGHKVTANPLYVGIALAASGGDAWGFGGLNTALSVGPGRRDPAHTAIVMPLRST